MSETPKAPSDQPAEPLSADAYYHDATAPEAPADPSRTPGDQWLEEELQEESDGDDLLYNLLLSRENVRNAKATGREEGRDTDFMDASLAQIDSAIKSRKQFLRNHTP